MRTIEVRGTPHFWGPHAFPGAPYGGIGVPLGHLGVFPYYYQGLGRIDDGPLLRFTILWKGGFPMMRGKVLLISPDEDLIQGLKQGLSHLKDRGITVSLRRYPDEAELERTFARERPSTVIVGLSERDAALKLIELVHDSYPETVVAGAHVTDVSDLILGCIRVGARDYIGLPADESALRRLLQLQPRAQSAGDKEGRVVCFLPARGGCGGSTAAVNVAAALSRESDQSVLFMDLDFHAGTADLCLGLNAPFTLGDAVRVGSDLENLWGKVTHRWNGIDVLAAPRNGFSVHTELIQETPRVIESARRHYDWVVCDLPPAVYSSSVRVLNQTEAVYLVCTPELLSLKLARRRADELIGIGVPRDSIKLVANRVRKDDVLQPKEIAEVVRMSVPWSLPNDYKTVADAIRRQSLIAPDSELGKSIARFARGIVGPNQDASGEGAGHALRSVLGRVADRYFSPAKPRHPQRAAQRGTARRVFAD